MALLDHKKDTEDWTESRIFCIRVWEMVNYAS